MRNNPVKYTDPTGNYVCTGQNEKWGNQTCYDVIDAYLDYLYKYGGEEGQILIEQFMAADAKNPVTFNFTDTGGAWGNTNWATNTIKIYLDAVSPANSENPGYQASLFGHELFHLVKPADAANNTPEGEKAAYDFHAKLLANMGVDLEPDWMVAEISKLDIVRDREKIASNLGLSNPSMIQKINNDILGGVGYKMVRALVVTFSSVTGCYGSVCVSPGSMTHLYSP